MNTILMPMPKIFKNQTGNVALVAILILGVLAIVIGVVLYTQGIIKLPGKSSSINPKSSTENDNGVEVGLKNEYQNPFDKSTQYENPFSDYKNPFDKLK